MRRFLCAMLSLPWIVLLLSAPVSLAQEGAMDAILSAIDAMKTPGLEQDAAFEEAGGWLSATVTQKGQIAPMMEGVQTHGIVVDMATGERVTFADLFIDEDAAAERMERIAEESTYKNAYSEYNEITPMPRDSFVVTQDVLTVYYPATMLSMFSGRSGGFSYYAYELEGLLREGVPLLSGDSANAREALWTALSAGALPGPLAEWALGRSMAEADEALSLVDVPDLSHDFALYRFEAPEMRGVSLLSFSDDEESAVIEGIMAERIDFSGLFPGVSTKAMCLEALGEPARTETVADADAYSRLPNGETLLYEGEGNALAFHFVGDMLQSVTLLSQQ